MGQPNKGSDDYLELGDWNAVCWVCGNKRKASNLKKHWQGYWVCPEHWEARHPQDFVKGITEKPTPPWVQPQPGNVYVLVSSPEDRTAIVDVGIVDYAIVNYIDPMYDPTVTNY